jgi:FMN reductase
VSARRLAVVSAGLSQPSSTRLLADRLAAATATQLQTRGHDVQVDTIELRDHAHAVTDHLITGFPSAELRDAVQAVTGADGLIAVTPVFTASYSGLFKMFFDVLDADALAGKAVLVAATGGTERHSLVLDHALRPMFGYLHSMVVPTGVYAASSDWGPAQSDPAGGSRLAQRIERAGGELAELVSTRPSTGPVDAFADPTPFADLLAGR